MFAREFEVVSGWPSAYQCIRYEISDQIRNNGDVITHIADYEIALAQIILISWILGLIQKFAPKVKISIKFNGFH